MNKVMEVIEKEETSFGEIWLSLSVEMAEVVEKALLHESKRLSRLGNQEKSLFCKRIQSELHKRLKESEFDMKNFTRGI